MIFIQESIQTFIHSLATTTITVPITTRSSSSSSTMLHLIVSFLLSIIFITTPIYGFDLGLSPNYYKHGDKVDLLVNKVESDTTQLPFSYYSLPFVCPPMNGAKPVHTSLGELLKGERIWQSGYELNFGVDVPCNRLCDLLSTQNGIKKSI